MAGTIGLLHDSRGLLVLAYFGAAIAIMTCGDK